MATQEQFDNIVRILVDKSEAESALDSINQDLGTVEENVQDVNDAFEETGKAVDQVNDSLDNTPGKVKKVGDEARSGLPKINGLGKAFEKVFNTISTKGGKAGATFGTIFSSVKGAIPMVQKLTTTITTGLGKVAGAIASTGIGAILIALGASITLITKHWEGFLYVIGSSKEEFQALLDKVIEFGKKTITVIVGAGNVIVQNLVGAVKVGINAFKGLGNVIKDVFTFNWSQIKQDADKALTEIKNAWTKQWDIKGNYEQGKQYGEKFIEGVTTMINYKSPEAKKAASAAGKEVGEEYANALFDTIKKRMQEEKDLQVASEAFRKNVLPKLIEAIEKSLSEAGIGEGLISLEEILSKETMDQMIERYLQFMQESNAILVQEAHDGKEYLDERKYVEDTFNKDLQDILYKRSETMKEEAQEEYDISKEVEKTRMDHKLKLLEIEKDHEMAMAELDPTKSEFEKNKRMLELEQERLQARKKYYEELQKWEKEGTPEWESLKAQLEEVNNLLEENSQKQKNLVELVGRELTQYYVELAKTVSDTFSSIADMYEEDSRAIKENAKAKLEAGKISKEEYQQELARSEQQFKRAQQLQIATTIVNTIAGAIGAFLQASEAYPPPYGQVLGAATSAAVLASGLAQVQALKNKSFDSGDVGGVKTSGANVGVTPIKVTDDIQVSPSALANSQSPADQRVYILEGDIQDSNKRVEVREANSSF